MWGSSSTTRMLPARVWSAAGASTTGAATAAPGSSTVKVAPWPRAERKRILPPCSLMMPWQIDRPRPVPSPSALVVKKGSKTRACSSSGMPGPSSVISTAMPSSQVRACTRTVPPRPVPAIACAALLMTLRKTCWSWLGLPSTGGRPSSTVSCDSTLRPMSWLLSSWRVRSRIGPDVHHPAILLLAPGESQQVSHDARGALRLVLDDADRLDQAGRRLARLAEKVGEAQHRGEGVVQLVGHAGDELADGRQLFRLDQLFLEALGFGDVPRSAARSRSPRLR